MDVTTKSRAELKARFVKNSIPTENDFANLIDGLLNLQDDGVVKAPGNPLSIQADGESSGPQKVLSLYTSLKDANPAWSLSLNPRSDANNASSARPGFNLSDGSGASRLFIDRTSGNVGLGTITPGAKLEVNGSLTVNGSTTLNGNVGIGTATIDNPGGWNKVLDILGTGNSRLQVRSSGGVKMTVNSHDVWEGAGAIGVVGTETNHALRLMTSGTHRLIIDSVGNVGIGTTSPKAKLEVTGGTTILEQQAWQDAVLVNNWVRFDGYNPAQYFKDSQGIVHLRGLIRGGTVSVNYNDAGLAFTLPEGYRPPYRQLHSVSTFPNSIGRVDILSDGRVIVLGGNNVWIGLDDISFRVA